MFTKLKHTADLIKFSHSIFALPFALGSVWLAADGFPGWRTLGLVILAMVSARSTAMAFNRLADAKFDAQNPRTATRPLTAGLLSEAYVIGFILTMTLIFFLTCAALTPLALRLAPIALLVICAYSLTKRFTWLCHLVLGASLGIAPMAAQIAVQNTLTLPFIVLGCAVMCWVAGFDILYALHDIDFDRRIGLHSIPARFGIQRSLWISRTLHLLAASGFVMFGALLQLNPFYFVGTAAMGAALVIEHWLIRGGNLARLNAAFFTANGWVSVIFLIGALLGR